MPGKTPSRLQVGNRQCLGSLMSCANVDSRSKSVEDSMGKEWPITC